MKNEYKKPILAEMEIDIESPIATSALNPNIEHTSPDIWDNK